jgi:hypothetical protein
LLHDEGFVSLGEFNMGAGGVPVAVDGNPARFKIPEGQNSQLLDDIIIALQQDESGARSRLHEEPGPAIVGGKFRGDETQAIAELSTSYVDAFGSDFSDATGTYAITAPTSPADSLSGIWFFRSDSTPSLIDLAALPEGWTYEGWVLEDLPSAGVFSGSAFYSTGKFLRADSADLDGAGPGKGPGSGLNFPGQDFITGVPARPNLTLGKFSFMITIEPSPDNSTNPFFLQILNSRQINGPLAAKQSAPGILYNVAETYRPRATVNVVR